MSQNDYLKRLRGEQKVEISEPTKTIIETKVENENVTEIVKEADNSEVIENGK